MKRLYLLSCLLVLSGIVIAQTQTLPDMRISGENSVKAYLYKRSLLFNALSAMGDSLPAFVPPFAPSSEEMPEPKKMKHRSYLQLEANAEFGLNGFVSFYPKLNGFNGLTNFMELRSPDSDLMSLRNNLSIGVEPNSELPLAFRFDYYAAKADSFKLHNLDFSVAHHRAKLDINAVSLTNFSAQIAYNTINQRNLGLDYKRNYLDYYLSTTIKSGLLDVKTKILGQAGEGGIQLAPLINWEPYDITRLRLHLLADAYNWIPSLEFYYRDPLIDGGVFSINNDPTLESNPFSSLLDINPWVAFSDAHRLQKTPLNLTTGLEFVYPLSKEFSLSRLGLFNTTRYDLHVPIYTASANNSIPELRYTDVASNNSSIDGFFRLGDFQLHQGVDFELAYLSRNSWRRAPYRTIFSMDTRINYTLKHWIFSFDLLQNYFTKDHQGNDLPEALVINLGTEYRLGNSAIYAQAANLLNKKQWVYSQQVPRGRNLYLGAKHRF